MLFSGVSAEEYQRTFDLALSLILSRATPEDDPHEMAHLATEAHFRDPTRPMDFLVRQLLEVDNRMWAALQPKIEIPKAEAAEEFGTAEAVLDLGRFYQTVAEHLSFEDRFLFRKVCSAETLTDDEYVQLDALGAKVRRVLDAATSTKKFQFRTYPRRPRQAFAWEKAKKSRPATPAAHASGDRRSGQRLRH